MELNHEDVINCAINNGCQGGWISSVFNYLHLKGGCGENFWKYSQQDNSCFGIRKSVCDSNRFVFPINFFSYYLPFHSDPVLFLKQLVATYGSIALLMDSSHLMYYSKGILTNSGCSSSNLNHAVTLIGFSSKNGISYWIIKNSFGNTWGENGFVKNSKFKFKIKI
eukprot:Anaeramoba_ignava/a624728_4.p1 GENE.a624728_4~~a624728_4.p1  ORF type:complete len:166 (-),score=45.88 a624728_4:8-505(-)